MKPRATEYAHFVEHPRYGKAPRLTGFDVTDSPDGKVYCHWHSPPGVRVANTAIAADISRQAPATLHVTHYFDSIRACRTCERPFLFFAEEQKHWYEDLAFPLEADCLECPSCRKTEQRLRALHRKYDALFAKAIRTEDETLELAECALLLIDAAIFSRKTLPRLRGLLKPLLADPIGQHFHRAQALASRIDLAASGGWIRAR